VTGPFASAVATVRHLLAAQVVVLWRVVDDDAGSVVASTEAQLTHGMFWEPPPEDRRDGSTGARWVTEVGRFAHFLPADVRLSQSPPLSVVLCAPLGQDGYRVTAGWADAPPPDVAARLRDPLMARVLADLSRTDALARAEATSVQLTQVLASLRQAVALTSLDGTPGWVNAAAASLLDVPAGSVPATQLSAALTSLRKRATNPLETEAVSVQLALDSTAEISDWMWSFEEAPTHLRVTTSPLRGSVGFGRSWVFDDMSAEMQSLDGERRTVARLEASEGQLRGALEVLSTSEDLLRATVEGTLDPQALLGAVRDGQGRVVDYTYLLVNEAALAEWGRPREQVVGKRLLDVFPGADVGLLDGFTSTLSSGDTLVLDEVEVSDAQRPEKPRFLDIRATRAPGDRLSVSWANVTERREASAALKASNVELAEAQRLAHAGSWFLDTVTGEVTCSAEMTRILGLAPGSGPSRLDHIVARLDGPTRRRVREAIDTAAAEGRASEMEFDLERPDGERRHVRGRIEAITPLSSTPGETPARIRGTVMDVTDSHLAAESRARRVARHADYLTRVEHTLRTNLSVVEGWAGILEADFETLDPSIRATAVTAMRRNATALVGHVQALMNGAAQDARAESLVIEPVDIAQIAGSVAADYQGLTQRTVTVSSEEGLRALGSPEALDTVLRHLVENAVRHTGDEGRIDVVVEASAGHTVHVVVRDNGPGIAAGVPLFSAFSKSATSKGHGLGLHVVQTLVEAMGGSVEGRNRADGAGAEFVVTLRLEEG
jgi:signal transduction histidine kinase